MSTAAAAPSTRRSRRRRFYFEIHFGGGKTVAGDGLFTGMLEADRAVSARADEVAQKSGAALRGYMITRRKF